MTALPAATDFTGASITEAQFKTAITDQRAFLAGLLATDGTVASALTTLGALGSAWVSKTGSYTVATTDRGKLIGCSGTFSLSLTAAATLGDGFSFAVLNYGTGVITIDPNSSEQIDGATTITLGENESCVIMCTGGTAFRTIGRTRKQPNVTYALYTTPGTDSWVCPDNVESVFFQVIGGGGGGGGANGSTSAGAFGGYGGAATGFATVTPGTTYSITVGAGGAGGNVSANGASGSQSLFDTIASATGGTGGTYTGTYGTPGTGTGGTLMNYISSSCPFSVRGASVNTAQSAVAASSTTYNAGAFGQGGAIGSTGDGGVGGAVLIIYVGA